MGAIDYSAWLAAGILAAAAPAAATTVSLLNNGDFETAFNAPTKTSFTAADYGKWAVGDKASTSGAANNVTPLGGSLMFAFGFVPSPNVSADVYQVVDVTAYAAQIDAGLVTADLSVFYNGRGPVHTGMTLWRSPDAPTNFSFGVNGITKLAGGNNVFLIDSNPSSWEEFDINAVGLTSGTRYLLFGLNMPAPNGFQVYADNASLLLNINDGLPNGAPEPGTLPLVVVAALSLAGLHRRARS